MLNELRTTTLQRTVALLLAVVMTVSGTGVTAFAADLPSDDPAEAVQTTEETDVSVPENGTEADPDMPAAEEPQPDEEEPPERETPDEAPTEPETQTPVIDAPEPEPEPEPEPIPAEDEAADASDGSNQRTPVSDGNHPLVEQRASENEPLLADRELTAETRAMLARPALRANSGQQTSVEAEGMSIDKITLRWLSKSTGSSTAAGFDRLELVTETDQVGNQQFQIDFHLSGEEEHEAGTIELVFPAYIWLDRDGKEPGYLTLAVPEDPYLGADFSWKRVGDQIVVTNTHTLSAASKVMIQGTFRNVTAHEMVDIDTQDENARYPGISDEFNVTINLVVPSGKVISLTSNSIDASIDTMAAVSNAVKNAYNSTAKEYYVYHTVPSHLPAALRPENPDDYIYVRWYISGTARGSQPFTMKVTDRAEDEYDCIMLGVEGAAEGTVKSEDNKEVTATLYQGYNLYAKSAYIWTAYPKSAFPKEGETYTIHNTQTISVTGVDDGVTTTMDASATAPLRVPITYTVVKEWDDHDNAEGRRPSSQTIEIYRDNSYSPWRTVSLTEGSDGTWSYSWNDGGQLHSYSVYEGNLASGRTNYTYDPDGTRHWKTWHYTQTDKEIDNTTHTWTFTNTYGETEWTDVIIPFAAPVGSADIRKSTVSYTYNNQRSATDHVLNTLRNGTPVVISYNVYGTGHLMPWTKGTYFPAEELTSYGKRDVTVELEDTQVYFDTRQLTTDDYEVATVTLSTPASYSYSQSDRYSRWGYTGVADNDLTVTLWGLQNGSWIRYAVQKDGTVTAENGAEAEDNVVTLPAGVERVKTQTTTRADGVRLGYTVGIRVKPSAAVLNLLEAKFEQGDYVMSTVDNYATLKVFDDTGSAVLSNNDNSRAWLHGRNYKTAVTATKSFEHIGNDAAGQRIIIRTTATVTEQSNILDRDEYDEAVASGDLFNASGGIWYDLLPPGVRPDLSTVTLSDGDVLQDVYTVENYKGSGRTLLVAKVDLASHVSYLTERTTNPFYYDDTYPREGYRNTQTLTFNSYYDWDEILNYGLEGLNNVIAFESDDTAMGNISGWMGEPDDPGYGNHKRSVNAVGNAAALMTDLDADREDPSFVYAGAELIYSEIDLYSLTDLHKQVTVDGSGVWSYGTDDDVTVYENGHYSYRVSVRNTDSVAKDIVIFDALENYTPSNGGDQWHGALQSIDLNQMKTAGVDPVVYYSTVQGIRIDEDACKDKESVQEYLKHSGIWTTTAPDDLSTVTAIAIDAGRAQDGSDFKLQEGEFLYAYLHMQAPMQSETSEVLFAQDAELENDPTNNAHAYNNIYLSNTNVTILGDETYGFIRKDYTKVGILPFSLTVTKQWDDMNNNDGKRPEEVIVHLYANGRDTGNSITIKEDANHVWQGEFTHIPQYDKQGKRYIYSFVEENCDGYTSSYSRSGNEVTIVNSMPPEQIDVPFTKTWSGDDTGETQGERPEYITVRLLADGVFTGETRVVRPDRDGNWQGVFTNVNRYRDGEEIRYTVEEVEVYKYIATYDGTNITNTYHPYGDLAVTKHVKQATDKAAETAFSYTLLLHDSEGNELTDKYAYEKTDGTTGLIGNGDSFTLRDGETLTVSDLPTESGYQVVEDDARGFTLTSHAGDIGLIRAGSTSQAVFENTYNASGYAQITAQKELEGRTMLPNQFRFQLLDENGSVIRTASSKQTGEISFSRLSYTEADDGHTFTYSIVEEDRGAAGYTYDASVYTVKVTPHDTRGDGTMTCDVEYFDADGVKLDGVIFRNEYHATGELTLRAWKSLKGRTLKSGEFTFELVGTAGGVIDTTTNSEYGDVIWKTLRYTERDVGKTFLYIAREVAGDDVSVIYDTAPRGYEVTVEDNGDGTLSFTQTSVNVTEDGNGGYVKADGDADLPVFTNVLKSGELSVTKYTSREDGGAPDTERKFKFQVRLIGPDVDTEHLTYEVEKVENTPVPNQPAGSNPTSGSIVPTTTAVSHSGTLSSSVKWTIYTDGTLVIEPTNGVSGTFNGTVQATGSPSAEWPWHNYRSSIRRATVYGTCAVVGNASSMLWSCENLTEADLSGFDMTQCTSAYCMFAFCHNLNTVNLSNIKSNNLVSMQSMFKECYNLKTLDLSGFDTPKVTTMSETFASCNSLALIIFGSGFAFTSDSALPSGTWQLINDPSTARSAESLRSTYNSALAGTWVRQGYNYSFDYSIAFDANGGTGNMETISATIGETVTLPTCEFQNDSPFLGWATSADAETPTYLDGASVPGLTGQPDATVTLYAVWGAPTKYTVIYRGPEGSGGSMATEYFEADEDAVLSENRFVKPNCTFNGWIEEATGLRYGKDGIIPAGTYRPGQKVTLTARLVEGAGEADFSDGTFTFELSGGEKLTIPDLPAGTAYQVWEETPSGWVLLEQKNASGTIQPLETAEAVFHNQYQPGVATVNIIGAKTLDELAAEENAFRFELVDADTGDVLQSVPNQSGGFIQFEQIIYRQADVGVHNYIVREADGGDTAIRYDDHTEKVKVTVTDDGAGNLSAAVEYVTGDILFENATRPGELWIKKEVEGQTDANRNAVFTFRVQLSDSNGIPLPDGERVVTAMAGETVKITGLSAGLRYTVTEEKLPAGWTESGRSTGETGTIPGGDHAEATVVNIYSAKGSASIVAHKQLIGGTLQPGAYTFQLLDSDGQVIDTVTNSAVDTAEQIAGDGDESVDNPWYGTAPIRFADLTFTETGTYTYTIRETAGTDDAVLYDTHSETVTVAVTDNGNGTLGAVVHYDSDGALFQNSIKTGTLTVSKTVKNGTSVTQDQTFTFVVNLKDANGNRLADSYRVVKSDGDVTTVSDGGTVEIKGGETFTVEKLPHGCRYTIIEQGVPGYELTSSAGASGRIDADKGSQTADFENTYSAMGSVTLRAQKELIGGEIEADQFSFQLTGADGQLLDTAYAETDGSITFRPLDYFAADDGKTYTYYISEVQGDDETVHYDEHTEEVTVKVSDNGDGTMEVTETYASAAGASFTNYKLFALTVSKRVEGNLGDRTAAFPFTIALTRDGEPFTDLLSAPVGAGDWTPTGDGAYSFTLSHGDSFRLLLPVGIHYEITEDPADYTVEIKLADAEGAGVENEADAPTAAGTLTSDQTVSFTNLRSGNVPTGIFMPAMPTVIGISVTALTGLAVLRGRKRKKEEEA